MLGLVIFTCFEYKVNHLFIAAIAVYRLIHIVRPLHFHYIFTWPRVTATIVLLWACAFGMVMISLTWNNWEDSIQCSMGSVLKKWYAGYVFAIQGYLVFVIILVIYVYIFTVALKQKRKISPTSNNNGNVSNRKEENMKTIKEIKATKTLALIVGLFALCLIPYCTLRLVAVVYEDKQIVNNRLFRFVISLANILANSTSAINPIVYGLSMKDFNVAYRKLLGLRSSSQ